jgi:hypothetical protein
VALEQLPQLGLLCKAGPRTSLPSPEPGGTGPSRPKSRLTYRTSFPVLQLPYGTGLKCPNDAKQAEDQSRRSAGIAQCGLCLRFSDLRAEAPNSNYPLFIVASEDRRRKVFEELRRPTFSGPCLRLNEVIRFLGYEKLREIDESSRKVKDFDTNVLLAAGRKCPASLSPGRDILKHFPRFSPVLGASDPYAF